MGASGTTAVDASGGLYRRLTETGRIECPMAGEVGGQAIARTAPGRGLNGEVKEQPKTEFANHSSGTPSVGWRVSGEVQNQ